MWSLGRQSRSRQITNERESFNESRGERSQDRIDRGRQRHAGVARNCRGNACGAQIRFGEYEDESGSCVFRREAVAAKRNWSRPRGLQIIPLWRKGGVAFGPKPRDYSKKISKTVRRLAFQKALSERITAGDVLTIDTFAVKELKTKGVCLVSQKTNGREEGFADFGFV